MCHRMQCIYCWMIHFCFQGGFLLDVTSHSSGLWSPYTLHISVQHDQPDPRPFAKVSLSFHIYIDKIESNLFDINIILISNQAHLQDVPFVLELAWDHCCPSSMQVCPQTGLPGWPVPALGAIHPAIRQALLPLSSSSVLHMFPWLKRGFPARTAPAAGHQQNNLFPLL